MNLVSLLEEQSADATAIIEGDLRVTYGDLAAHTRRGAAMLRSRGLEPGDAILFFHPVSVELYLGLLSVIRSGMTAVFMDPSAPPDFMGRCCDLVRPKAFFGSRKARYLLPLKVSALRSIPKIPPFRSAPAGTGRADPFPASGDEPALVTFTSGSTGEPKGVARSHRFLLAQHASLARSLHLRPGEIDLVTLPVFVLGNLASGTVSVLADTDLARPGKVRAGRVARQIRRESVERIVASPAFFESLLRQAPEPTFESVRHVFTGGAPVFPATLELLRRRFPRASVAAIYGSTEAEPIAEIEQNQISAEDLEEMRQGGGLLAGHPVPGIELDLPGGEIVVTGDHVLEGYLHGRGDAETKFTGPDGRTWHRTGDLGRLDDKGRLWLLGRKSARIGENLFPFAVECALSFVRGIGRTALIEDEDGQPVLFFEGKGEIDPVLSRFGIGRSFPLRRIPVDRRHNAKIDYPALRRILRRRNSRHSP